MDIKRKFTYILSLSTILFIVMLLVSGGTYAFWEWESGTNTEVVFYSSKSIEEYIVYDAGESRFVGDFQPKNSFCESANLTHTFYKTAEASKIELIATINMQINWIGPNTAASNSVYWVLTASDNTITCEEGLDTSSIIASGNFNGKTSGDIITLKENISMSTSAQHYTVWIWIDSNGTDLSTLSGETLDTNIWTKIDMLDADSFEYEYQEPILNGASPKLQPGMIPVSIANDGTVTTIKSSNEDWYSYTNKKWANVVLVTNESRSNYYESNGITIKENITIPESNILAYFVWIPKFSYKINGKEQPISITFNNTPSDYIEHPAFMFDGSIQGFWVGKFDTGHKTLYNAASNSVSCSNTNCTHADGLIIKPNVISRRSERISNMFYASRSMERNGNPFGLISTSSDTHMMKNTEWGAVTYLSHSQYGINGEVRINNSSDYTTGCGAETINATTSTTTCDLAYGSISSGAYPQSTTGNITGIFDMSGGANEYVMGYHTGAHASYQSNPDQYFGYTSSGNAAGFGTLIDSKYWDEYQTDSYTTACNGGACIGQALHETASWYEDLSFFVSAQYPWLCRGGYNSLGASGGIFLSAYYDGRATNAYGWRITLIVT